MIEAELKKKKVKEEDGSESDENYIIINGIADEDSFVGSKKTPYAYSYFYNDKVIEILTSHSFSDVGKTFSNIQYRIDVEWWESSLDIDIYCNKYNDLNIPCIKIDLQIQEWEHWAKPWSISSVAKQFEINIIELANGEINYWQSDEESILNGFGLEYYPANTSLIIDSELSHILTILETLVNKTNKSLLTSLDSETVLTYFLFPEEIKTACKQYLVYFSQFIADMGIIVDIELKEEINHTLFKIIPKDKLESLDRIREALNIYLTAPNENDFQVQVANQTNIAVKQWEANFYHLKSQLSLATSIIQAKDSTIEMLQLSNYQYKQLLESHTSKKDSEKEEIIKGIVSVKKYEGKGFSIDFAEIFRRLKRTIKK